MNMQQKVAAALRQFADNVESIDTGIPYMPVIPFLYGGKTEIDNYFTVSFFFSSQLATSDNHILVAYDEGFTAAIYLNGDAKFSDFSGETYFNQLKVKPESTEQAYKQGWCDAVKLFNDNKGVAIRCDYYWDKSISKTFWKNNEQLC